MVLIGVVALVVGMLPSSFLRDEATALAARAPGLPAVGTVLGVTPPVVPGTGTSITPGDSGVRAPTQVVIPRLGLREDLLHLGLGEGGQMEVPEDPDRVGWFSASGMPSPGLPLVIAGHVDSRSGPAVFARLSELQVGDRVVVVTGAGREPYVVTSTRKVPQDAFPTQQVFGATTTDTLRLVTCTGPYDHGVGRYTRNLVVTARRA